MQTIDHPPMTWRDDPRIAWPMKKLGHAQLGTHEGAMLYYLGRDWVSGHHPLLELGSFLGASASLTAAGLMANPAWDGKAQLHCYDIFEAKFGDMAAFIRARIDPAFEAGADFQHLFEAQTKEVAPAISIHKGDLTAASWEGGAVDLLFVDIAKSPALNRIVLDRFLPSLRVGPGLMVNQDFHNPDNPWIHTSLGYLLDHFDLVEPRADDSILLRLTAPIPEKALREAGRFEDLSTEEALDRVDRLLDLFETRGCDTRYIQLVRARLLIRARDSDGALALVDEALERFGPGDPEQHFFWLRRCRAVQEEAA